MDAEYDYIVVGGGSSGCIAAGELARDGQRVLLLEAGDRAEQNPETLVADGYKKAFINERLFWTRFSTRQPGIGGKRLYLGSGRGMGGSGSVNGMVYTRGDRRDFIEWGPTWQWEGNAPAFAAVEQRLRVAPQPATPLTRACIAAAEAEGFRHGQDLNDGDLGGVLGYESMNHEAGKRRNAYVAFVKEPAYPSLTVRTGCRATRVVLDGNRAVGVAFLDENGTATEARSSREVILCAGALESPRLLLLSGIGPRDELARHGIPCAIELPGVGANLQDHPNVVMFFVGKQPTDYTFPQLYGFHRANPDTDVPAGASDSCYVFYTARSSFKEGVIKLLPAIILPLFLLPLLRGFVQAMVRLAFALPFLKRLVGKMWGIVVILGKPRSRGTLRLSSADPLAPAEIDAAYFADPEDRETMRRAVRKALGVAAAAPLEEWGNKPLMAPGGTKRNGRPIAAGPTDRQLDRYIDQNVMTTYHYAGTCKMGTDEAAVVDEALRVRGAAGLRVADASIIPVVPVSAMNAPSMMIGYRVAEAIRAEQTREGARSSA